jgi:hypothetical protein
LIALLLAASFKASVLSVTSTAVLERWLAGNFLVRMRDGHRGPARAGEKTLFPIVVQKARPGSVLVADFEVRASDGRVVLNRPGCCRATKERAPGVYVLDPIPELTLMASDLDGLYTATATVRDETGTERIARERIVCTP